MDGGMAFRDVVFVLARCTECYLFSDLCLLSTHLILEHMLCTGQL